MNISRLFGTGKPGSVEKRPDGRDRLPPGQYVTKKWPILSAEATPKFDPEHYRFRAWGAVEEPIELTWDQLQSLPHIQLTADFHCVTTWSRYENGWEGIHVREILKRVRPKPECTHVMAHSYSRIQYRGDTVNYTTNMPLSALDDDDVLIAFKHDGVEIEPDHGGPVRLIVPKLYAYKSAKWLSGLEFMTEDRPGFWEENGYSNSADPWKEERYW
jgi:DMSO/TMAO reductase YedYZ molybdopterin-dependent catalytic subunit